MPTTTHIHQVTQLEIGTDLDSVLSVLDTTFDALMAATIATPPTGYQPDTIRVPESPKVVFDGTSFNAWNTFFYTTKITT